MLMASASVAATSSSSVTRGGTLRLNASDTDYEYLDPALAYDAIGWATLYAVNMMLLNYPDKPASAGGNQLVPEAATGFPTVSKDGKTYVFTVKRGHQVQRRLERHGRRVRAVDRACLPSGPGLAGGGVREQHRRLRRLQPEAGRADGCQGSRSEADGAVDQARSDVPGADRDAVLRGGEAEHADQPAR